MKKTGIFYSFNTDKTKNVAKQILDEFKDDSIEEINVEVVDTKQFLDYENYILGVPTWFDGELPNYWDEFLPAIEEEGFSGKTIALFGLGDQKDYPENFVDAIGVLGKFLEERGATIVGLTSTDGYTFEKSQAERDGKFLGLAIDFENQSDLNDKRIGDWVKDLKKSFK
jgi:flavodoxin I